VLAVARPEEGFEMLERLARSGDADLVWIARSNLGRSRLERAHPAAVERLRGITG
jgi:hypothetical protein